MSVGPKKQPKPVSGAIDAAIHSLGLGPTYNGWMVVQKWPELVGEQIARRANAFRYADGILYVAVVDAAWRQNLAMELEQITRHIRSYPYGRVIKEIRLVASERGIQAK